MTDRERARAGRAMAVGRARRVMGLLAAAAALTCAALLAAALTAGPATPRLLEAAWGNLDGLWLFRTDPAEVGEADGWQRPTAPDTGWRALRAPGFWEEQGITDARPGQPPRPRGRTWTDYDGVAWYRLRCVVPARWAGQPLMLHLGSVDDEDRVFVNGVLVGATGPGVAHAVTVDRRYRVPASAVRAGRENVIVVRVKDGGGPGGLAGPALTLLPEREVKGKVKLQGDGRPLHERFQDPPASARVLKIIHGWPDGAEAQDLLIRSLASQGFGGVVCNVSFDQYLESEGKWAEFTRAVRSAREAGMAMWLYDERGYPSGTAGSLTLRGHPEMQARGLLLADAAASPRTAAEVTLPPGKLLYARAYREGDGGIDLNAPLDVASSIREGRLHWEPAEGQWRVVVVTDSPLHEGTHASMSLGDRQPYINLAMPEATARFLRLTHDAYAARLGNDLGRWFEATFTDEPSLMSMWLRTMPYRVVAWAPEFAAEFRRRRGYDIEPLIPALLVNAGPRGERIRVDYWRTVADLVAESFFGQTQAWCRAHGTQSGGHLLAEEDLASHVPLYGDFFRCARRLDAPSIDCLTSIPAEVPWQIARLIGSAADLEGRALTMCETSDHVQRYRPAGDTRPIYRVTEEEIRGTCNRLILGGINTITSYYAFEGITTEQLRRINLRVGRACTMLRGGHQVVDVAVLYPAESLWAAFVPASRWANGSSAITRIEGAFDSATQTLFEHGRDLGFVDSRTLAEARVERGELVRGAMRWRALVLPAVDTLPEAAWDGVERFWRAGGIVIALGALPRNTDRDFPSARCQALARTLFGDGEGERAATNGAGGVGVYLPTGSESLLARVLDGLLDRDARPLEGTPPLKVTHRRVDDHDLYFLYNDGAGPWAGRVETHGTGRGEAWDPAIGDMTPIDSPRAVPVSLEPYGAVLLRFPGADRPARHRWSAAVLPSTQPVALPTSRPRAGGGEFVRVELAPAGEGIWRARGTLTRGEVDTHLFVTFPYEKGAGLRDGDLLQMETGAPKGQRTPTDLLVLLHEKSGAIYVASTGRLLGEEGRAVTRLSTERFALAPWSRDTNGRLDAAEVDAISIGWGGYFGKEGEAVEFTVAAPRLQRVRPAPVAGG
ncbi:MAG: hypothetical protein IT208_04105 [Chthonomonadales bacterium]|nr:hypothetical protein [Chthonomonadales bacterium]